MSETSPKASDVSNNAEITGVLQGLKTYGTLVCFVALVLLFWALLPDTFMTARNITNISQQMSMLAVVAFAMTIVMSMGDFDLSVGSMASLAGIVAAVTFRDTGLVPLGIALALAVGLIGGVLNGFLVSYLGILPFVATLGTLTVFSGCAFWLADGKTIFGADIPESFSAFAKGGLPLWQSGEAVFYVPMLTIMAAITFFIVWFMLQKMVFGRHLYAMGGSSEAARLAGVNTRMTRLAAFALVRLGCCGRGTDVRQPRRLRQPDARGGPDARRHRRRLPRHDHEPPRRTTRAAHARGGADPRDTVERPDAVECGQLCPRYSGGHDHHHSCGGEQRGKDAAELGAFFLTNASA